MCLLVRHHLQPILDDAQETIGSGEIVARRFVDPAALRQGRQRLQGLPGTQLRMASAGDELLSLHEEFDLADTATTELDVVSFDRDLVVAAIGVDLPLHRVDVGDRREVEILAPDERRQLREQRLACRDIAGARPRLDQRGTLPVLPAALVVVEAAVVEIAIWVEAGSGRSRRSVRNT